MDNTDSLHLQHLQRLVAEREALKMKIQCLHLLEVLGLQLRPLVKETMGGLFHLHQFIMKQPILQQLHHLLRSVMYVFNQK